MFKPCLYLLIGVYSEWSFEVDVVRVVFAALTVRLVLGLGAGCLLWVWLPADSVVRATLVVALLSPSSTMVG
jgi:hypothetical protein